MLFYDKTKFSNKEKFFNSFPKFTFKLDTFDYEWSAAQYLTVDPYIDASGRYYCQAFNAWGGSSLILGGTWMRSYDILFDRENY